MGKILSFKDLRLVFFVTVIIVLPAVCFSSLDTPFPLAKALLVSTVILWISELIPLAVTSIMIPVLGGFYQIVPVKSAFDSFGNQTLFLFIPIGKRNS